VVGARRPVRPFACARAWWCRRGDSALLREFAASASRAALFLVAAPWPSCGRAAERRDRTWPGANSV